MEKNWKPIFSCWIVIRFFFTDLYSRRERRIFALELIKIPTFSQDSSSYIEMFHASVQNRITL